MKWKSHNLALEKLRLTEMLATPSGLAPSPEGGRGSGHVRDAARETHDVASAQTPSPRPRPAPGAGFTSPLTVASDRGVPAGSVHRLPSPPTARPARHARSTRPSRAVPALVTSGPGCADEL